MDNEIPYISQAYLALLLHELKGRATTQRMLTETLNSLIPQQADGVAHECCLQLAASTQNLCCLLEQIHLNHRPLLSVSTYSRLDICLASAIQRYPYLNHQERQLAQGLNPSLLAHYTVASQEIYIINVFMNLLRLAMELAATQFIMSVMENDNKLIICFLYLAPHSLAETLNNTQKMSYWGHQFNQKLITQINGKLSQHEHSLFLTLPVLRDTL